MKYCELPPAHRWLPQQSSFLSTDSCQHLRILRTR